MNTKKKKILSLLLTIFFSCLVFFGGCAESSCSVSLGNVVIFGDSYSTFEGHIPDGYASWYKKKVDYTDVNDVKETWWHQLIRKTNSELLLNCSYSGTTICHTGYDGEDLSTTSFVGRMNTLIQQNYFQNNQVDTLIVYGGLNDYWAHSPLGELKYENWTQQDLFSVYPAFTFLLATAKEQAPNARIIVIIEEYLSQEIKEGFITACQWLSIETVSPTNISKQTSHPNQKGMKEITSQIIEYLENVK